LLFFDRSQSINVKEAKAMITSGNVIVIDVRSPEAYQQQHVDGAVLGDKKNWRQFIEKLDKAKPVICYCYKGISSRFFCSKLRKAGFRSVVNLKGGFDAWKKSAV